MQSTTKNTVHAEVCIKRSDVRLQAMQKCLQPKVIQFLKSKVPLALNLVIEMSADAANDDPELALIKFIKLECPGRKDGEVFDMDDLHDVAVHIYCPHVREMEQETLDGDGDGDSDAAPSSNHWLLPTSAFVGMWENLIYDEGLKDKLLRFAMSALVFSHHNVDNNIISCNRLILLHGPPGTGKTSLCKALAQKLSIRAQTCFRYTHLIEINSHSLFSKWFSESGKLVMRLFSKIREIVSDPNNLVCVLIDEVESIAYARDSMSGQEPKDGMRVVNALLTQLDSIKEHPNVIVLATSNLANSIDNAFIDRADIKQYIGLPGAKAIRKIYESMLLELMRVGIVQQESLAFDDKHEGLLCNLSERSVGLSGRTLRKLPYLAHAAYSSDTQNSLDEKIPLYDFLDAMLAALEKQHSDQQTTKGVN